MDKRLCQLSELELSCYGCCAGKYFSEKAMKDQIKENTESFHEAKDKKEWGCRERTILSKKSICYNIIKDENLYVCALHPMRNDGVELRPDARCDIVSNCESYDRFSHWYGIIKDEFIDFIKSKNMSSYDYSFGIVTGMLIKEFERSHDKK